MASSNKKGGADLGKLAAPESTTNVATTAKQNVFARHGNQQITEAISTAQTAQKAEPQLLASLDASHEAEQQTWWQEDEATKKTGAREEEDEKTALVKPTEAEEAKKAEAKADHARGRKLTPQEEHEELKKKRSKMSAGALQESEKALLVDAADQGLTEEEKAEMLVHSGHIDSEVVAEQSGEVQAYLAAEQLPAGLADLNRDAAATTSLTPLDDRQTMRNLTDELRLLGKQIHNFPSLTSPGLSVEAKATALVDVLASQLDVQTRESLAAHPYIALVEDMIFDPQAVLEINAIAGGNRDVRTMGGFSVVLWQACVDSVRAELNVMDAKDQLDENHLWGQQIAGLSRSMYADALMKPSVV